jgi:hypothetical protein
MTLLHFINGILMGFRSCFSRAAAFEWFVVVVVGLLVRTDHLGVTSVIRGLLLCVDYMGLIGFFRSSAWKLEALTAKWCALVQQNAQLVKHMGAVLIIGDGVKKSKEGRRMPGVKRLHQESGNSSSPDYIWGHLFGGVGVLVEKTGKHFCLPLALILQDGVKTIFGWGGNEEKERQASHVPEMIMLAGKLTTYLGKAILLLDRYFLSIPALLALDAYNAVAENPIMHIVTKAKCNCSAYHLPVNIPGQRGRPRKKGASIKMFDLFVSEAAQFKTVNALLYGKPENIRYYCLDLLWGKGLYKMLRFVLVEYNNTKTILVTTDLALYPVDIILLYGKRFGIEVMFREMKQVVGAFDYRFWSKYMPKINRFKKKTDTDPIDQVANPLAKKRIKLAVKAMEGFMFCSIVATGLLQMASLQFSGTEELKKLRYLRTYRNSVASEATIADFIKKNLTHMLYRQPDLPIAKIISSKQNDPLDTINTDNAA